MTFMSFKAVSYTHLEAKNASRVYLATDPDREGEAISWHLAHTLNLDPTKPLSLIHI